MWWTPQVTTPPAFPSVSWAVYFVRHSCKSILWFFRLPKINGLKSQSIVLLLGVLERVLWLETHCPKTLSSSCPPQVASLVLSFLQEARHAMGADTAHVSSDFQPYQEIPVGPRVPQGCECPPQAEESKELSREEVVVCTKVREL